MLTMLTTAQRTVWLSRLPTCSADVPPTKSGEPRRGKRPGDQAEQGKRCRADRPAGQLRHVRERRHVKHPMRERYFEFMAAELRLLMARWQEQKT